MGIRPPISSEAGFLTVSPRSTDEPGVVEIVIRIKVGAHHAALVGSATASAEPFLNLTARIGVLNNADITIDQGTAQSARPISTLIQGEDTVKSTALFGLMLVCDAAAPRDVDQIPSHFDPKIRRGFERLGHQTARRAVMKPTVIAKE